jgi:tartrate-resistant acid phosphatase type 5
VSSTYDELWDSAFHDVFVAPSLTHIKWYGILGNHDYHGSVDAQVDRSVVAEETMWTMPSTYYYVDYKLGNGAILTIVYIDTCLLDPYAKDTEAILSNTNWVTEREDHLDWIDTTLEAAEKRSNWILVAGHYPIYSIGEHGDDTYLINDLLPIIMAHKVHAYLAGHDHSHQHIYKDGLHHIIAGMVFFLFWVNVKILFFCPE